MPLAVYKSMTIPELRETLATAEDMERLTFDPESGRGRMVMTKVQGAPKLRFAYGSHEYRMTSDAFLKFGQMLGIPAAYTEKTPLDLMVPHYNWHLQHSGKVKSVGLAVQRTPKAKGQTQQEIIQAFVKNPKEAVLSNHQILDVAEEVLGDTMQARYVSHDVFRTCYSLATNDQHAVAVGDVVRSGITIRNSYTDYAPLDIASYIERLVCTNGATSPDHHHRYTRKIGEGMLEWVQEVMEKAYLTAATVEVERVQKLQGISIERHIGEVLESVFAEYHVPSALMGRILSRIADADPPVRTMYDLYNLLTWFGSNDEEVLQDVAISSALQRAGGQLAAHPEMCRACHRILGH